MSGLIASSLALSRLKAPERLENLLWFSILGAVLGEKLVYILTDPHYYLLQPSHLFFTPQSTLGRAGLAIGTVVAGGIVLWHYRKQWSWFDSDRLAIALSIGLSIAGWGWPWIGSQRPAGLLSVMVGATPRFPTYALWSSLWIIAAALLIWRRHQAPPPRQLSGLFLLALATIWLAANITTPWRGHPFTLSQWLAWLAAIWGFRWATPSDPS
ncbi:MAG: prolipoprotein diacylglyceryl transferase [Firmicutes bacterium]|nr:prolipoprotein diacylglyceryl transferase [Bacillota bacterium]